MIRSHYLRGTTALVCLALAAPVAAQEEGGGFLGTLVFTAGKRDLSYGGAVSRTVVDSEEISDRQASTIAQLIDSVPSVELINGGNTPQGSAITIRGYGASTSYGNDQKIGIQIDGASVGSEELYRISTQLFTDPLLFKEVEVLRGTIGSFAYGSGIVGGVVKLETKDASDFTNGEIGLAGSQTFEFSSNGDGAVSSTTLAWQPTQRAEFLLNYAWRQQDLLEDGDGNTIDASDFETPSALAKGRFTFGGADEHSVMFSYTQTLADEKDVPYDQMGTTGDLFGNVDRLTETRQGVLEYAYNPTGNDLVDLTANLSYADQKIEYDYVGSSTLEGEPSFPFLMDTVNANQRYETTKLTVRNRSLFATGAVSHDLLTGVEVARRDRADNVDADAPGGTDRRFALFAVDEMSIGNFTVTPALRYETSTVKSSEDLGEFQNDATMGGIGLAYDFNNGISVFGSAAYTEGLPIIDDLGSTVSDDGTVTTGNMKKTEKSQTFEVGASYTGTDLFAAADSLTVRGNYYDTTLWDVTSYSGVDHVETEGFELEASYGLSNGIYFDLNGHIGEGTEYAEDGETTWRNTPTDRLQFTAGRRFGEALDVSWEVVHSADRRDAAGEDLDDVTLHNLRATWKPDAQGWLDGSQVRFGVENVTDEQYIGHRSSETRPAPGRNFKLTLTKLF